MAWFFRKREKCRSSAGGVFDKFELSPSYRHTSGGAHAAHDNYGKEHAGGGCYLNLGDNDMYGVRIASAPIHSMEQSLVGVRVTDEITVESHVV